MTTTIEGVLNDDVASSANSGSLTQGTRWLMMPLCNRMFDRTSTIQFLTMIPNQVAADLSIFIQGARVLIDADHFIPGRMQWCPEPKKANCLA
jgi:hypothetical protein